MKYLLPLLLLFSLAACGGAATDSAAVEAVTDTVAASDAVATTDAVAASDAVATTDAVAGDSTAADSAATLPPPDIAAAATENTAAQAEIQAAVANAQAVEALNEEYANALPVQSQLALGTVQLESTELAVTAEQAGTLLTYWQVLQTLVSSGTAAEVEIDAVLNQLQAAMTPEQLGAIAALKLTEDSFDDFAAAGMGFGRGMGQGAGQGNSGNLTPPEGGARPGGGMGPGGGLGPGGGAGSGGGMGLEADPAAMATRQAAIASGDTGALLEQSAIAMVIRALQVKTGEFAGFGGGTYATLIAVLAEATGLDETAVREELAAGATPTDFLAARGADTAAARAALVEALGALELAEGTDTEALADQLLAGR